MIYHSTCFQAVRRLDHHHSSPQQDSPLLSFRPLFLFLYTSPFSFLPVSPCRIPINEPLLLFDLSVNQWVLEGRCSH